MSALVTKESMINVIKTRDPEFLKQYVGRALVGIFNRQLADEKSANTTSHSNGVGFASCDATGGSLTAKYFLRHGTLADWQLEKWTKANDKGVPKICKYHKQLNEIAETKKKAG